jgi:nitrogen fixation/metabolism regulation signal transduction histidine kinase
MKRYYFALLIRLIPLIFFFLITGFLLAIHWYQTALITFVMACYFTFSTISFLKRTIKDAKRLIDALQFSEFNITFKNFTHKGLFPELIPQMEKAVAHFNEKLQQTEIEQQFYDMLLNRIDSALLVIGKAGEIEWINKAALNEFGKPQPRWLADLDAISPELHEIMEKIVPGEVKIIKIKREGFIRQLAATAVFFNSRGKELKLVSLRNIQSVLEESESDAWKKLIRVLTHEMMNSITPIISLADTFSEQNTTHERDYKLMTKAMQTIHRRSKGLVEFVGNYQKLARIPAPVMNTFSAEAMMNDINDLLHADGIHFSRRIHPGDMTLTADRIQMEQVLINLLKNAWEACEQEQSPEINIRITKNEYQKPVIVVSDNGCGILPDVLDKIFVPFFTTKSGGSGIGLSICRQIVVSHGGTITVESEPEKGTRVILNF